MPSQADDIGSRTGQQRLSLLALTRKPHSPSFEQRFLRYIEPLRLRGIDVDWREIPRNPLESHLLRRQMRRHDAVWWHRYLIPPWLLAPWRRAARRIIFDFDDPLIYNTRNDEPRFSRRLKFRSLLRHCDAALPASGYLAALADDHCDNVFIVPMAVDIARQGPERRFENGRAELLWLGSRSTQRFLAPIFPALEQLTQQRDGVSLRIVGHEDPRWSGRLRVDFRPWSPREQEKALAECDVGLCPMPDTPWTRGKCPYKVLQYMSVGMPWAGSAVGENLTLAGGSDEPTGFCGDGIQWWCETLIKLTDDAQLRRQTGAAGRSYVLAHHSREALADRMAELFRRICQ